MTQFSWPEIRLINANMLAGNEFSPEKFSQRIFSSLPQPKLNLVPKENTQYYLASFNCFSLADFEIGSIAFSISFCWAFISAKIFIKSLLKYFNNSYQIHVVLLLLLFRLLYIVYICIHIIIVHVYY